MQTLDEIKDAINSLPPDAFAELRSWFSKKYWKEWDEKLEKDSQAGKLDFLVEEAMAEKNSGNLTNI